jgi:DNA-binding protein HU-beta
MNKSDLIGGIADNADISKADAGRALEALIKVVKKTLKSGDNVAIVGFGTFSVRKRAARTGRNPQTGATLKIKASKNPAFKAGKALKDSVN